MRSLWWNDSTKLLNQCLNQARFTSPSAIIIGNPTIGRDTWIGHFTIIDGSEGLIIGKNCSIASGAHIYTHSTHQQHTQRKQRLRGNVKIGNNVAIGANAIVMYGCRIEDNALIGALSLLRPNTHVGKHEFWAGNPAKLIKVIE